LLRELEGCQKKGMKMRGLAVGLVILLLLGAVAISCSDSDSTTSEPMTEDEVRAEVYDIFCGALALASLAPAYGEKADSLRPESWQFERVEDGPWHIQGPGTEAIPVEAEEEMPLEAIENRILRIGEEITRRISEQKGGTAVQAVRYESKPGLWLFYEQSNSLMPYDEAARLWADNANFGYGYGKLKASEAED
jgi:hypothetical protein